MKYMLKEPVDAVLFEQGNMEEVRRFIDESNDVPAKPVLSAYMNHDVDGMYVYTLYGTQYVRPGAWVVRDASGEFYPCSKAHFDLLFAPVPEVVSIMESTEFAIRE